MSDIWGERGSCPSCGSPEVVHFVFGLPADPGSAPSWVRFGGCVISGLADDRECESCGHLWVAPSAPVDDGQREAVASPRPRRRVPGRIPARRPRRRPDPTRHARGEARLLSADGASFALTRVPTLGVDDDVLLLDVELLSPDRLIRYLARPVTRSFVARLADSWLQAAADPIPEASVPTVEDEDAGLAVLINQSTELDVIVEIIVVSALDDGVPEQDGISFEVPRASLIKGAHDLRGWLG